jgi:glycerophosphoryl diester phosphodiesterase
MSADLLQTLLERGRRGSPVIAAHRGSSARAPENTLAAFLAALEDGAEMIELDVHLTADGRLAVIHDETTERTTGVPGAVAEMTMAQLRELDAARFMGRSWAGQTVPELGEVLDAVRSRLLVNVEIKGPPQTAPVLARCLDEHEMRQSVIVSSFAPPSVTAITALRPPLLAGLLLDGPVDDPLAAASAVGASLLHVKYPYITADLAHRVHAAGLGLVAWTVDEPTEMLRLRSLGVDAIISDDPLLLRETLAGA